MDRLTSMAVFIKVADLGSFAAAADIMNISPQMVAKHIVFLEDRLSATLINRTTRRQSLTAVGKAYYNRCRVILAEVDAADSLAYKEQNVPQGILRVNAPPIYGACTLAPVIPGYLATYPEVELELTLDERRIDPIEDGYEVVVRIGEHQNAALIASPLTPFRLIACASPAYIARRGMPESPTDLKNHDCLPVSTCVPGTPTLWAFSREGQEETVCVTGKFCSNEWQALLHAALQGFGVILGPEAVLLSEISKGNLVRVMATYDGPSMPVHILYPASRGPSAKIQSFVDYVSHALR